MSDDRHYSAGTKEALFMLSRGYCYEPSCKARVMRWEDNRWNINVFIAHIHGRRPNAARFRADLVGDPQLDGFGNLILLCDMHHRMVDAKRNSDKYPPSLLKSWKTAREGNLADELDELDWLNQERLQELMSNAVAEFEKQVLDSIGRLSDISSETLGLLQGIFDEAFRISYLDSGDIARLAESAHTFQQFRDYIPLLTDSTVRLRGMEDYSLILADASLRLSHLSDDTSNLSVAIARLEDLRNTSSELNRSASRLEDIPGILAPLRNLSDTLDSGRLFEAITAADRVEFSVNRILDAVLNLQQDPAHSAHPGAVVDNSSTPPGHPDQRSPWSWYEFRWGFAWGAGVCAIFTLAVIAMILKISGR